MILKGELRVEAALENLRKVSDFVRDVGQQLRLTEEALLNIDLAVEERPRSPDSGGYPRRPVRHGVLRCARSNLRRANVL